MIALLLVQSLLGETGQSPYDPPKRPAYKKHDHLQILVYEKTRALSQAELRTDRWSRMDLDLDKWIRFDGSGKGLPKLAGAELENDPGIDLDARFRRDNQGRTTRQFDLTFAISAEVVDVRPNGVLVIQAIKRRKVNDDEELIRLTGEVAPDAIVANCVKSDKVVNFSVTYEGSGAASDVSSPGVVGWILDKLWPF
jgi:flagellar L-ring protein precursor FlgH